MDTHLNRRRLLASAAAGLAATSLGHLAPIAEAAQDAPITLRLWDNDTFASLAEDLDEIMRGYEQVNPNVKIEFAHAQDLTKTLTAISSGAGPDIVWLWDGSGPLGSWAESGAIQPLDAFIGSSGYDLDQLQAAALETVTYKGQVYGLPLVADTYWLWWNKAALTEVGLDPDQAPTTMDELWRYAEQLTIRDGDRIERLGMNLPDGFDAYQVWAYAFGARFFDPETNQLTITTPEMVAAMNNIKAGWDLFGPENVDRFTSSLGQELSGADPFLVGKIVMKVDGDWVIQAVRDNKPEWEYPRDFGLAAVPWAAGVEQAGGPSLPLRTYPLVMPANTPNAEAAWGYIQWLQSAETTEQIAGYLINLPQTKEALESPELNAVPGFGEILETFRTSENVESVPPFPQSAEFTDAFVRELDLAFHGKQGVEEALEKVRSSIQPQIDAQAG